MTFTGCFSKSKLHSPSRAFSPIIDGISKITGLFVFLQFDRAASYRSDCFRAKLQVPHTDQLVPHPSHWNFIVATFSPGAGVHLRYNLLPRFSGCNVKLEFGPSGASQRLMMLVDCLSLLTIAGLHGLGRIFMRSITWTNPPVISQVMIRTVQSVLIAATSFLGSMHI